jgi:hypothetical protein
VDEVSCSEQDPVELNLISSILDKAHSTLLPLSSRSAWIVTCVVSILNPAEMGQNLVGMYESVVRQLSTYGFAPSLKCQGWPSIKYYYVAWLASRLRTACIPMRLKNSSHPMTEKLYRANLK